MNANFDLKGRVAVVTGAAGRMGQKVHVPALLKAGARVYGLDLQDVDDQPNYQNRILDATNEEAVQDYFVEIATRERRLDILVNNAVIDPPLSRDNWKYWDFAANFSLDVWSEQLAVGLTSYFITMKAATKHMAACNCKGSIINIASQLGVKAPRQREYPDGFHKSVAYTTLKHAVIGLTRAWAADMARNKLDIRVNALCPASVDFGLFSPEFKETLGNRNMLGRPVTPEEVASAVVYLASDASSGTTGSVLMADGGEHAW
jgi:NAD(P)-dependent dehydrogenase (short-subunit alcohol dehydrogenase family)